MGKSISLKDVPLFKFLSDREIEIIEKLGISKKYKKGEIIIEEREKGDSIYIINSGEVKVSLFSEDGKEITLTYLKEGDFFGEVGFFGEEERTARVTAIKDTDVTIFHREDLLYNLMKHPEILISIIKEMAERIKKTNEKLSSLVFLDVSGRIARYFIEKAEKEGEKIGEYIFIKENFKIKEIASAIGSSRESVSRIINELKRINVIKLSSKGIFIHQSALKF
ncbi:MAG: Crp/Fnr family transcriptional regulator [candidate division WOR-3 bacterium]